MIPFAQTMLVSYGLKSCLQDKAEANEGRRGDRPQETICRKVLLSCRNFCDLNDKFWSILRRIMHKNKHEFLVLKHKFQ